MGGVEADDQTWGFVRCATVRLGAQGSATFPVGEQPLSRREREQRSGPDCLRGSGVAGPPSNRIVSTLQTPKYSGVTSEGSGRTRDHAPSAPMSRLATTVVPPAKLTSSL